MQFHVWGCIASSPQLSEVAGGMGQWGVSPSYSRYLKLLIDLKMIQLINVGVYLQIQGFILKVPYT